MFKAIVWRKKTPVPIAPENSETAPEKRANAPENSEIAPEIAPQTDISAPEIAPQLDLSARDRELLALIATNPKIIIMEMSARTGMSRRTIQTRLKSLKDRGLISHAGPNKGGRWEINGAF